MSKTFNTVNTIKRVLSFPIVLSFLFGVAALTGTLWLFMFFIIRVPFQVLHNMFSCFSASYKQSYASYLHKCTENREKLKTDLKNFMK